MDSARTSTARLKAMQPKQSGTSGLAAAKSNVVQQAKLMDSAGTAWHAVKYGNLEMITRLFPSQCNVYSKGPVGDNVFHIAMLLNTPSTLAIAKYLVKLYGKTLVNTPYQERKAESDSPGQYEGETALHIAIVNHDFDMVKFLVQNGADVRARAYGSFFQPGSAVYYGEFPLSFAACTGQKDIVSYLKRHGARVNHDRDQWGNTALHMCVSHDQPDMYDHLVEYCGASEHVQNNRSQTPLLLAASLGKVGMLQHIYSKRRRVAWAYGPVTSYSLSLREIDTVQNPGEYVPSAIETSVRKGHLEVLEDPLVRTLLATKWSRFGRTTFLVQVLAYLTYVLSQTFLVWLISDTKLWNSSERFAMEVIGVILGGLFFLVDVVDFAQWAAGVFRRRKLMKAASKYRPQLYPIPGERLETMTTQKSNFLTRLIASNRQNTQQQQQNTQQPIAEGAELQQQLQLEAAQQQQAMERGEVAAEGAAGAQGRWRRPAAAYSARALAAAGGAGLASVVIEEVLDEEAAGAGAVAGGLTASAAAALEAAAEAAPAGGAMISMQLASAPYSAAASGGAGSTCKPAAVGAGAAAAPYSAAALRPAAAGGGGGGDSDGEWHSTALCGGAGAGAGPVAEGTEGPQPGAPAAGGDVSPFATAVGAASAPPPPPPPPPPRPPAAAYGSMAAMQQLYSQLAASGGAGGGAAAGTAATLAALQQQVAALHHVRAAAAGGGGATYMGAGAQHAGGALGALSAMGGGGGGLMEPVDFVSVGLGPGPLGNMPGGLMGGGKNAFAAAQQAPKVTTMLRAPDAHAHDGTNRDGQPHGRTSNPNLSGINRAPSLGGSVGEGGEIRNRMRGGGGDNVSGGLPRAATRRQTTNIASAEPGTYDGAGGGGGDTAAAAADEEPQPDRTPTWLRHVQTLLHAYRGYVKRMIQDPIQFVHVFHHSATLVHFVIWASTYGGVGGGGPGGDSVRLLEFDDVVVSLMALSGWVSMLYYSRGVQAVGQLVVLLERCWWEVVKFVCLYFIANIGFTLAFYTCANGATSAIIGDADRMTALGLSMWDPMGNIGYGMISMVRFLYGEASYEGIAVVPNHRVKTAFATMYWLLYVAVVLLLLGNVMTAMIMYVYSNGWADAEKKWRLRWAQYVLRAEARMPAALQQRTRLGEVSYDPVLGTRVYNHVFEVVEDGREKEEERDAQVKALEAAIDKIRSGAKRDAAKRG